MVAVKEFEFDSAKHTLPPMPVIHAFRQELESLRRVKHENVVALLGAQLQPKYVPLTCTHEFTSHSAYLWLSLRADA